MINKELPACRSCARWPGSKIACQRFGRTIESLLPKCLESRLLSCCSTLTGVAMKCDREGPQSGCAPSFASTDALPERGGNPFLIGTCKPQGSRGRTLPSAPRSWPLDASHPCPGACVFRPRRSAVARRFLRVSCSGTPVETPERSAAQTRLVSRAAAVWGSTAAQLALPGLRRAKTSDERDLLLHEL